MTHSFQFDPNTILGVSSGASLREIRDAYHQKSLKYHPDKGGDEWAFRMVARAYEILSTARVVDRAAAEPPRAPRPPAASPWSDPARTTWTSGFGPGAASGPGPGNGAGPSTNNAGRGAGAGAGGLGPDVTTNISGWSGERRTHAGMGPADMAKVVAAELLILRFELECSLDLFARRPEDRNLSCTLHIAWPLEELAERADVLPEAAKTIKQLGEAAKAKGVRKHALTKRAQAEVGRFDAWFTYPTAVMASEALEAFREALAGQGLHIEKQVREMAIPRQWK